MTEKKKKKKGLRLRCNICHKWGHMARDCRQRKRRYEDSSKTEKEKDKVCGITDSNIIAMRECKVDEQTYSVALDSCATLNTVTEEAAECMNSIRDKESLVVQVVGTKDLNLDEVIEIQIDLGSIQTKIKVHIVPKAPADILLGQDFILKYVKDYPFIRKI